MNSKYGALGIANISLMDLPKDNELLRQELVRYKLIADNTYNMEIMVLPDKSITYISPSCERVTGFPQEAFYQNSDLVLEIVHPDDRRRFDEQLDHCFACEITEPDDIRIINKDGVIVWIGVGMQSIHGAEGQIIGYRASAVDISKQKELDRELERTRDFYFKIVNNQVDVMYRLKPDGTITFVNRAAETFFRLGREKLVGANFRMFFKEEIIQKGLAIVALLSPQEPRKTITYDYLFPEGGRSIFEIDIQGFFNEVNELEDLQLISRDVTGRMQALKELEESESRYRAIVEGQDDLIIRYTPDNKIIFVNQPFLNFMGRTQEEIIGKNWITLLEVSKNNNIKDSILQKAKENSSIHYEFELMKKDGERRWISWSSKVLFDAYNNVLETLVVGRDLTDIKRGQELLEESYVQVRELKNELEKENVILRERYKSIENEKGLLAQSPVMLEVLRQISNVARVDSPVLISGESGVGKSLIAREIHRASERSDRHFIPVNCASIPISLLEAELFGQEEGAYTGKLSHQIGRFQMADKSTIFLDEVSELPKDIQAKLLRFMQKGEYQMAGSSKLKRVDVRVVTSSSRNIIQMVENGTFRKDLFYELNVLPISIPPLRDRKEDIPILAWAFIDDLASSVNRQIEKISTDSIRDILEYRWPGNLRELRNIIEYSMIINKGPVLEIHLPGMKEESISTDRLDDSQKAHIENILSQTGWKIRGKGGAAERLGIKESTLRYRMKKLGVKRKTRS